MKKSLILVGIISFFLTGKHYLYDINYFKDNLSDLYLNTQRTEYIASLKIPIINLEKGLYHVDNPNNNIEKNIDTLEQIIKLYDLENEMLNSVISYISSHITTHINNEHNSNSVMSYINSNCMSTDFSIDFKPYSSTNKSNEKIIVNDIIETFISFDHTAGLIDIAVENTISS